MITTWVGITPNTVWMGGQPIAFHATGSALLTELYRERINDYPKFFKMDTLCKLGFVASELLLSQEAGGKRQITPREDRAIVLFNRNGSLHTDRNFRQTIHRNNYFPSPSVFVYTLPNIVTGEIAIRNQYYGETSFYVLAQPDMEMIARRLADTFQDACTTSVVGGWVDCENENLYQALLFIVDKGQTENISLLSEEITSLYNLINI